MSSPKSIERFTTEWEKPIVGLVNNAGVQIVDSTRLTKEEGYEETFAVNHLYALKLTVGLMGNLRFRQFCFLEKVHLPDDSGDEHIHRTSLDSDADAHTLEPTIG